MKRYSIFALVCFSVFMLQSVYTSIRLGTKAYKQFEQHEVSFVSRVDELYSAEEVQLESEAMYFMEHHGDNKLIKHYFASQYAIVPQLISDKPRHQGLAKLDVHESADGRLTLQVSAPQ